MSKKALVTGGAGFIGSHVVDALVKKGLKVVIIDNLSTGTKKNINPKARFYKLDIRSKKVAAIFKKEKPDYVFHLAAQTDVRRSVADPLYDADVNILGSLNLLQNSVENKVKKFIFTSSGGAIYGDEVKLPTTEEAEAKPVSPYGASKLAIEKYLFYYSKQFGSPRRSPERGRRTKAKAGLSYVSLRYANVYGPRQRSDGEAGVVAIFIKKILAGANPIINGDGKNTRDYVYVEDVARANVLALQNKARGAYNIGTGIETTVNQIFKKIVKVFLRLHSEPSALRLRSEPSALRLHSLRLHSEPMAEPSARKKIKEVHGPAKPGEQRRSRLSYAKIKKELGWGPHINLEKGIKKTVEYMREF